MMKQYWKWLVLMILISTSLTACGKKKEVSQVAVAEEIPIEEETSTEVIDGEETETETEEDEVAGAKKDKEQTTTPKKVTSSTPRKTAAATTRSATPTQQPQAVTDANTAQTQSQTQQGSPALRSDTDDSSSDSSGSSSDDKSEHTTTRTDSSTDSEYIKVAKDPGAKNMEMLLNDNWYSRLMGYNNRSYKVLDFYYSSKNITRAQAKAELDEILTKSEFITDYIYSSDEISLSPTSITYVKVYFKEDYLFGDRKAFDEKYALAKSNRTPIEVEVPEKMDSDKLDAMYSRVSESIASMTDDEYCRFQRELYEFMLEYALKCDYAENPKDIEQEFGSSMPYVHQSIVIPYEEFVQHFFSFKELYDSLRQYDSIQAEQDKIEFLNRIALIMHGKMPNMSFWFSSFGVKDAENIQMDCMMFPVYETVEASDGSIVMDKTKYKSIATMAKEVDDKLNQVIEDVIEPEMSTFAKEYALFHYCDTYYEYDDDKGGLLGDYYAICDNPYTIGLPFEPNTSKKNAIFTENSTQGKYGIYTTAMTGWGICVGHADFFQALCMKAGISCDIMSGFNHSWNVVTINGESYVVDAGKRAPFPHFNLSNEWAETYKVVDEGIYDCVKYMPWFINSSYPTSLYQAGYVEETTQQDGEWIYYINFDDNGSLYKVKVDGSGNTKVCDSGTTLEDAYAKLQKNEIWERHWANAQYGPKYSGEGYTNSEAMQYRYALGHKFHLEKENGNIIYKVDNISRTQSIPLLKEKNEIINLSCYMDDAYYNLGVLSGTATINSSMSLGDSIENLNFYVDGIEYPASEVIEKENGQRVDFSFRLPTDVGMEHHELEIFVSTVNGGSKRMKVSTQTLHPTGIKESYLWNGKYYTIEGVTARGGKLTVNVERYTQDGKADGSSTLSFHGYTGKEALDMKFHTYKETDDVFRVAVSNGQQYRIQLTTDENVAVVYVEEPDYIDEIVHIRCFKNPNEVYIFTAKGFCLLADMIANGKYCDAKVEVCADLDFSSLPQEVVYKAIGTSDYPFKGTWNGNNYTMKGLSLDMNGNAALFGAVNGATMQDIYICDSNISGTKSAGVILSAYNTKITNLWIEKVNISGEDQNVGTIAYAQNSSVTDAYMIDVIVEGSDCVGVLCGTAKQTPLEFVQVLGDSKVSGYDDVGGIVGHFEQNGNKDKSYIKNCLSEAGVSSDTNSGGIAGIARGDGNISYCMNYGQVTGNGFVGGIVGISALDGTIYHVENMGMVQGEICVGGVIGRNYESEIDTVVNRASVKGVSMIGGVVGYHESDKSIRMCLSYLDPFGEDMTGVICGLLDGDADIYNTLGGFGHEMLTVQNVSEMFGATESDITILVDNELLPNEAGRHAYCKY